MSDWDESKHPRVPGGKINGGQFTSKQVDTVVSAAQTAAGVSHDSAVMEKVRKIADLDHEVLYAFAPETGQVLLEVEGDRHTITLDFAEQNRMKNKVVLHNHPGGNGWLFFSKNDLVTCSRLNVKESWLVAGDCVLVIKRPEGAYQWPYRVLDKIADNITMNLANLGPWAATSSIDPWQWIVNANTDMPIVRDAVVEGYRQAGLEAYWTQWR